MHASIIEASDSVVPEKAVDEFVGDGETHGASREFGPRRLASARTVSEFIHQLEDFPCVDDDSLSGGGQGDTSARALEESHAQLTFQTLDPPAEVTGRDVVAL